MANRMALRRRALALIASCTVCSAFEHSRRWGPARWGTASLTQRSATFEDELLPRETPKKKSKSKSSPKSTEGRVTRTKKRDDALTFMSEDASFSTVGDASADSAASLEEDPLLPAVHTAVKAADMRKAEGILALRVSHLTVTTEFFINMVGKSRPQNQAIAANIEEEMLEKHGKTARLEGTADSGWILLDFGDIIVNVMTPRSREYYDIESFWKEGEPVDLSQVLLPNVGGPNLAGAAAAAGAEEEGEDDWGSWTADADLEDEDEDPFWAEAGDEAGPGGAAGEGPAPVDPFWNLGDDDGEGKAEAPPSPGNTPAPKTLDDEDPFWS